MGGGWFRTTRYTALVMIGIVWAGSLLLPALAVRGGPVWSGLDLLLQGWEGVPRGVPAWFANPLFLIALLAAALNRHLLAGVTSAAAVVLAFSSFATESILQRSLQVPELTFRMGFYLWLIAMIALCIRSWAVAHISGISRD